MAMRIRFQFSPGYSLGYSIERLADGLLYDFSTTGATAGTFVASPASPLGTLTADAGNFYGRYKATLVPTPVAQFLNGDYCVTIHNKTASNAVIAQLGVVMNNGDDATVVPSASGVDPWSQSLPGSYSPGSAGYLLGVNVDAKVSTRLPASSYVAPPTDYQQRTQPVILSDTPPAWLNSPPAPSVAQIVAGVWDAPRAGHVAAGTFGSSLDVAVSSRLAAASDSPGVGTLLSRLTANRSSYLDALNISGLVASHADVAAVQNNTLVRIFVPEEIQRPTTGSITRLIHLYTYNEQGSMATPDTPPAVAVANGSGQSRSANLNSTTMSLVAPGHYQAIYTIHASDPNEQLVWSFSVVQGGQTRQYGGITELVDVIAVDFNANDRSNLNQILTLASSTGVMLDPSSKCDFMLSSAEHAAITADAIAALNTTVPPAPTSGSIFDRIDAAISTRSTFDGGAVGSVASPVIVGQNNDKSGYSLAGAGLDAIVIEPGVNARQALSPILAATAGVLTGAGTGTIAIRGGNVATTRIMAATDALGNRSAVVLTLPT